jgi:gliding-associated putative ABC transporter substrate-binding component GldG
VATTKLTHRSNTGIIIILVLAIVIVANVLVTVVSHYLRWDLTSDKRFTLSETTKKILRELPDRVTVNVYISEKFPAGLIPTKRRLEELLAEYQSYAPTGYFKYSFVDPAKAVEPDKYEEFMRELETKGVGRQRVQEASKTGGPQMYVFVFGITMEFRDCKPVALDVDVLQNPPTLEYHLTRGTRDLVSADSGSVAFLKGEAYRDVTGGEEYRAFVDYLSSVKIPARTATIRDQKVTPDDVEVLVIVGETAEMSQSDLFAIDQFVMKGGRLLVITEGVGPMNIPQQEMMKLRMRGMELLQPKSSPLTGLLASYGIEMKPGLLMDEKFCPKEIQLRRVDFTDSQGRKIQRLAPVNVIVPYYSIYRPENYNPDHVLTLGIGPSIFITASPLFTRENPILETKAIPLVYTSEDTILRNQNLIRIQRGGMSFKDWEGLKAQQDSGKFLLAVAMTGKFSSYFKGKPVPKVEEKKPEQGRVDPMDALRNLPGARSAGTPPPRRTPSPRKTERKKPEQPGGVPEKKGITPGEKPEEPEKKQPEQPPGQEKQPDKPAPAPEEGAEGGASGINEIDIPGGGVVEDPKPGAEPEQPEAPDTEQKPVTPKEKPKPETPKPGASAEGEVPKTEQPKTEQPKTEKPGPGQPGISGGPPGLPPEPPGAGQPGGEIPKNAQQGLPSGIPVGPMPPVLGNAAVPEMKTVEQSDWTQIVVIGDVDFLVGGPRGPHYAPPPGPPSPNRDYSWRLVRNILEWMLEDEEIVKIRGRGMEARNLKSDITQGKKMAARIFAIGGVPVLVVFAALGLWGMKRRRRRREKDKGGE